MEGRWGDMMEMMNKQAVMDTFVDILLCAVPIWVAVMIGLLIGWSWRPRWTGLVFLGLRSRKLRFVWTVPPGLGARRLWLAFTALSAFSVARRLWFRFYGRDGKEGEVTASAVVAERTDADAAAIAGSTHVLAAEGSSGDIIPVSGTSEAPRGAVTEHDLEHLMHLLDGKEGEMAWQSMMERSTTNMTYQAWRHEAETGLIVYRSRTVFEDATPELVRDFFWDDEFRPKWDPMLAYVKILEECQRTGMMIVHWIKKFPFFCSDREYIIGRRIWEAGRTFYCVTKGLPYSALPRRDKPRRVDLYFSSWIIRPVQSLKGDGQLSACEVTLVHYEDMGIPKDVAKLGVRHGMWGTVKKLHAGFRAYQNAWKTEASLSRCAQMARVATIMSFDEGSSTEEPIAVEEERSASLNVQRQQGPGGIDWKWLVVGGTVALVCGLHTGVIGKALLLGAGQRVARRQRNARRRVV